MEESSPNREIAHHEQFLLFLKQFSKDLYCTFVKNRAVWERVKESCIEVVDTLFYYKNVISKQCDFKDKSQELSLHISDRKN